MKRTPLYDLQAKLGAKLVPFAGWEMPLSYSGVVEEHHAVRTGVGLFDISHMGRFSLQGRGADEALNTIVPSPTHKMKQNGAQYSMLLSESGTVLDDIYIYKKMEDKYWIIVNASNREKDFQWMQSHLPTGFLTDLSEQTALLALQGPKSWEVLAQVIPCGMEEIALRTFIETELILVPGHKVIIARTGYTGERGYELWLPANAAVPAWNALMEAGRSLGIKPIGLGARDTLRLEMGYPLYGHELDEQTTPVEVGLDRFLHFEKEFIGKGPLVAQREKGVGKKMIGFILTVGGVPREGCSIYSGSKEIGKVTSGNFSPSLKKGVGMGFVDPHYAEIGSEIFINIHGKGAAALIVRPPFYKKEKVVV
jgi:aminomethyltransferase